MKRTLLLLVIIFITLPSFSQNSTEYFKSIPKINSGTPDWAKKMYSNSTNVFEVEFLHHKYFQNNAYQKDIHERNYLHWRKCIQDLIQKDGSIGSSVNYPSANQSGRKRAAGNWIPIGPFETYNLGSDGGFPVSYQVNVYSLDQSVSNPNILIAGTEAGDLFKTTDKGLNWFPITESLQVRTVTATCIAPSDSNTFYFCSGNKKEMYRSTDGGSSWNLVRTFSDAPYAIIAHPTNPQIVWTVGNEGLINSTDGGNSWSTVYSTKCWDIKYHPTNNSIMYLLRSNSGAKKTEFLRSTDSGATWTIQSTGWYVPFDLANASEGGARFALSAAAPNMIVVGLIGASKANDNGFISVYKSHDTGLNWSNPRGQDGGPYNATTMQNLASFKPDGTGFHQGFYNFGMGVSDNDSNRIWVGCLALSLSTDGGTNWERIGAYYSGPNNLGWVHPDHQDIHVQGNDIWIASDGGINYSNNELSSHESRKNGIYGSDMWGYGQGWNEDVMVGGRYHNGNHGFFEDYGFGNTLRLGGAESPTGYVNPLKERKVYFSDIGDHVIPDSITGPKIATHNLSIYPNTHYWDFENSEIEFDPRYAEHLYLGKDSVLYKSIDEGRTFTALHTFPEGMVYEIELCRSDRDRMYLAYREGDSFWDWSDLFRSTDAGITWTQLPDPPAANRRRMLISLNPEDEDELWGIAGGSSDVFKSTDGGNTWIDMETAILSGQGLIDIRFQAGSDIVYIVSNSDVFYWDSGTSDWINYSTGLPGMIPTLVIEPFYKESKIRLASSGKGIWETALAGPSKPIAQPMTTTNLITCSRDTVPFDCFSIIDHTNASWQWSFSPAPAFVSATNIRDPKVVFGNSGSYSVTLIITDGTGKSDTATVVNMVTVANECGVDSIPGEAMSVSVSGDYATTPSLDIRTNEYTITAWVKPVGTQPNYSAIVINEGTSAGFNFRGGNNTLGYHWPSGSWSWNSGLIVPSDEWSYVAMVATPDSMTLYLNGVASTHVTTLDSADLTLQYIGNYKGWGSRNMTGEIDEVRIWNRSLSRDEIRELRHLTLTQNEVANDPDLLVYYQFNESQGLVLDKKGLNHAGMNAGAVRMNSTAPVGGGESDRLFVNAGGTINFPNTESDLNFPSTGSYPNGEIVVSRLHILPDSFPTNQGKIGEYFIVNNYGSSSFSALDLMEYNPFGFAIPPNMISGLTDAFLHQRDENEYLNNWNQACMADTVTANTFQFENTCNLNTFGQFIVTRSSCVQTYASADICQGDSVLAGGAFQTSSGKYYNIATLPSGCDSVHEITVNVTQSIYQTPTVSICDGDSVYLEGTWQFSSGTYVDSMYTVGLGCDSIVETTLSVEVVNTNVTLAGNTLTAQAGMAYQWLDCDNGNAVIAGANGSSFTPTLTGNYAVQLTKGNCIDTSNCVNVIVVGIQEASQFVKLYPNPANSDQGIIIELQSPERTRFSLYDVNGKLILEKIIFEKKNLVDLKHIAMGIYSYRLVSGSQILNGKLIVE